MNSVFKEANSLLRGGSFDKALVLYRENIGCGVDSNNYFNLGYLLDKIKFREQSLACYFLAYKVSKNPAVLSNSNLEIKDPSDFLKKIDGTVKTQEDLKKMVIESLWGGYSFLSSVWLEFIINNKENDEEIRFSAAWQAARWYHFNEEYYKALDKVEYIRNSFPSDLSGRKIITMLAAFTYQSLGRFEDAKRELEEFHERKPLDPDCIFALSSLQSDDESKISYINKVYSNNKLAVIEKKDEKEPLALNNIVAKVDKVDKDQKVSVIIPAYNSASLISIAIESLLNQSWKNLEVIVVDDCSPDNTYEVAKSFEERDKRVKVIKQEKNSGAYAARNLGLKIASGDYITTHDADDWSHPQKIQKQIEYLEQNKKVKGICLYWIRTKSDLTFTQNWRINSELIHWSHSSFLFRREVLDEVGVWNQVVVGGDTEFIWRVQAKYGQWAVKIVNKNVPMSFALDDETSLTRKKSTHVKTIHYGLRHIYREMAQVWHKKNYKNDLYYSEEKQSFPIPLSMRERINNSCLVDCLLVGDFSDLSFLDYSKKKIEENNKIIFAFLHHPRFSLPREPILDGWMDILSNSNVRVVVSGQIVECKDVYYFDSDSCKYIIDTLPEIKLIDKKINTH